MRERLTRLIRKGINEHESTIENYVHPIWIFLAVYLLKNGVMALPCKTGDTVYIITPYRNGVGIEEHAIAKIEIFKTDILLLYHWRGGAYEMKSIDEIGRTVFFTREEAEQKLKELKGGAE